MTNAHALTTPQEVSDRVARRVMSRKRLWVWANVALFIVITAVMVLLSMAQRDQDSIRGCRERLEKAMATLADQHAHGQLAPMNLPLPTLPELPPGTTAEQEDARDERILMERQHYFYNARYAWRMLDNKIVGVACCAAPHRLYLRTEGRHVILFDGEHYTLQWLTEEQFQGEAGQLGLPTTPAK